MNEVMTLTTLANEIRDRHTRAIDAANQAVELAMQAGALLMQAKAQIPHGGWAQWVAEYCQFSERTARNYMQLARELPKLEDGKRQRVADLPLRMALQELSKSRSEPPNRGYLPFLKWTKDDFVRLGQWYDIVQQVCWLLFADGLSGDEIVEKTGFDQYEVDRIIYPKKPLRFINDLERDLLSDRGKLLYNEAVDSFIARMQQRACESALYLAERENMDNTIEILKFLGRQWQRKDVFSEADLFASFAENDVWPIYCCVWTDARIAIGLDRELRAKSLPSMYCDFSLINSVKNFLMPEGAFHA